MRVALLITHIRAEEKLLIEAFRAQGVEPDVILDRDLTGALLAERIRGYFSDRAGLERMATAARALGRPDAAARIVDACYSLARA